MIWMQDDDIPTEVNYLSWINYLRGLGDPQQSLCKHRASTARARNGYFFWKFTLLDCNHEINSIRTGLVVMGDSIFGSQNLQSWRLPYQLFNICM